MGTHREERRKTLDRGRPAQHAGLRPVAVLMKIIKNDTLRKSFGYKLHRLSSIHRTGRIHSFSVCGTRVQSELQHAEHSTDPHGRAASPAVSHFADGHHLILGDYGSMELRAAGCISGDRKLLNVFEQGARSTQ